MQNLDVLRVKKLLLLLILIAGELAILQGCTSKNHGERRMTDRSMRKQVLTNEMAKVLEVSTLSKETKVEVIASLANAPLEKDDSQQSIALIEEMISALESKGIDPLIIATLALGAGKQAELLIKSNSSGEDSASPLEEDKGDYENIVAKVISTLKVHGLAPVTILQGFIETLSPDIKSDPTKISGVLENPMFASFDPETKTLATNGSQKTLGSGSGSNSSPSDILLSNVAIDERLPVNSQVGGLSTVDPDNGNTFVYTLTSGSGDDDNSSFAVDGANLIMTLSADYAVKNSFKVRLRSTDQGGLYFDKSFEIAINRINRSPSLSDITNKVVDQDSALNLIPVTIGDPDGALNCTTALSALSDDTILVPPGNFAIKGTYPNCTLSLIPSLGLRGTTTIRVQVSDGEITAEDSFVLDVRLPVPGAVRYLGVTSGLDGQTALNWTLPKLGGAPSSYRVYRSLTSTVDTSGAILATVAAPTLTYTDTSVSNGTPYWYAVVAANATGVSATSSRTMRGLPLSAAAAGDANNVFISPTGNDTTGNGSIGNPYLLISKALAMVNSGGTIFLKDGTYGLSTGTQNITKAMTIQSMTGDYRTSAAIISQSSGNFNFNANNVSWIGLETTGVKTTLPSTERLGAKLINCLIRDLGNQSFINQGDLMSATRAFVNFEVYGSSFQRAGTKGTHTRSFLLHRYTGSTNVNWLIEDNLFEDSSFLAIDLGSTAGYNIKDNVFRGNCEGGIQVHNFGTGTSTGTISLTGNTFDSNVTCGSIGTGTAINLSQLGSWSSNIAVNVSSNAFTGNRFGVRIDKAYSPLCTSTGRFTSFSGNYFAASNVTALKYDCTGNLPVLSNFWGHLTGPVATGNPSALGSIIELVSGTIDYSPWLDF